MKVIQILPNLSHNGIARSALELSKALVKAEHESIVISESGELVSRLEKDGGQHINVPFKEGKLSNIWQTRQIRKIIQKENPDIIHLRARMPAWITHLALQTLPEKNRPILVSTIHDIYSPSRYANSLLKTDHVISVSDFVHNHLVVNFSDFNPENHTRIYRGIDPKAYPYLYQPSVHWWNNTLAEFPDLDNKIWITMVGSVKSAKGHQWLIDVIGGLKKEFPKIHAVVVGDDNHDDESYTNQLKCLILSLGLEENFTFTGKRDDIREWLSASNIVLAIDKTPRSFGRTILESVSMGTPVVGWNQGGVAEILSETFPEGLVEKEDCLSLIDTVKAFIEENNRPDKSNHFLLKPSLCQILELYKSLIDKKENHLKTHGKHYRNLPEASNIISIKNPPKSEN